MNEEEKAAYRQLKAEAKPEILSDWWNWSFLDTVLVSMMFVTLTVVGLDFYDSVGIALLSGLVVTMISYPIGSFIGYLYIKIRW